MRFITNIKNELLEKVFRKPRLYDRMPRCLAHRFRDIMLVGAGCLAASGLGVIISMDGDGVATADILLIFAAVAAAMFLFGLYFRWQVLYRGYDMIQGEVTSVRMKAYMSLRQRQQTAEFRMMTDDGRLFRIPVAKKGEEIIVHSKVQVFMPKDTAVLNTDGALCPISVWGYEILSEPTEEDAAAEIKGKGSLLKALKAEIEKETIQKQREEKEEGLSDD